MQRHLQDKGLCGICCLNPKTTEWSILTQDNSKSIIIIPDTDKIGNSKARELRNYIGKEYDVKIVDTTHAAKNFKPKAHKKSTDIADWIEQELKTKVQIVNYLLAHIADGGTEDTTDTEGGVKSELNTPIDTVDTEASTMPTDTKDTTDTTDTKAPTDAQRYQSVLGCRTVVYEGIQWTQDKQGITIYQPYVQQRDKGLCHHWDRTYTLRQHHY